MSTELLRRQIAVALQLVPQRTRTRKLEEFSNIRDGPARFLQIVSCDQQPRPSHNPLRT